MPLFRPIVTALALCLMAGQVAGQVAGQNARDLIYAMGLREMVEIMQVEGIEYGESLADELFPDTDRSAWKATVQRLHDTAAMEALVLSAYERALGETDVSEMLVFFNEGAGAQIVQRELEARRAMVDPTVEDAALERYRAEIGKETPRLLQIETFANANDLVEANVTGALNASYQFYAGLVDGGAFNLTESEIIRDIWSQEDDTRTDSREWVYGFLLLAYGTLDNDVMEEHVALTQTEAGQAVNQALFAGFNAMYNELSYAIGLAAAQQMQMTDL